MKVLTACGVSLACGLFAGCSGTPAPATPASSTLTASDVHAGCPVAAASERVGQSDFDFELGAWKAHLARRRHPLTGSGEWVDYEGTSVVRKVWNGRANLGELELDGPGGHIEGLSLRLYDPKAHTWNIRFASSADGALTPALTGGFHDGRGEFFDEETLDGTPICVRFVFSEIATDSFRFEQAFSPDHGKTWEANWVSTFTRTRVAIAFAQR